MSPSEILRLIDLYVITDVPKRPSAFNLRVMQSVSSASDKSLSSRGCGRCGRAAGTSFVSGKPGSSCWHTFHTRDIQVPIPSRRTSTALWFSCLLAVPPRRGRHSTSCISKQCLPQNFLFIIRSSRQQSMLYNRSY